MRSALLCVTQLTASPAGQAAGPDLTRYLVVCGGVIAALLVLAWGFRRFVAGHVKARAAKRSLQVIDVLPLSSKQKLVVVRCYDRSFLLGLGDKEVRAIAELDREAGEGPMRATDGAAFAQALEKQLEPAAQARPRGLGSKEGLLA